MELKPGSRWRSAVSDTEVVIVRSPDGGVTVECGGYPMLTIGSPRPEASPMLPALSDRVTAGKRYSDSETGLELLVSKTGLGPLTVSGRLLEMKKTKSLPSSD
jgi:hypothetical protein